MTQISELHISKVAVTPTPSDPTGSLMTGAGIAGASPTFDAMYRALLCELSTGNTPVFASTEPENAVEIDAVDSDPNDPELETPPEFELEEIASFLADQGYDISRLQHPQTQQISQSYLAPASDIDAFLSDITTPLKSAQTEPSVIPTGNQNGPREPDVTRQIPAQPFNAEDQGTDSKFVGLQSTGVEQTNLLDSPSATKNIDPNHQSEFNIRSLDGIHQPAIAPVELLQPKHKASTPSFTDATRPLENELNLSNPGPVVGKNLTVTPQRLEPTALEPTAKVAPNSQTQDLANAISSNEAVTQIFSGEEPDPLDLRALDPMGATGSQVSPANTSVNITPVTPRAISNFNAQAITEALVTVTEKGGQIDVSLAPEDLGRLTIKFDTNAPSPTLILLAERSETQDMIRRHFELLQQQFRNMGFENMSFAFHQDQNPTPTESTASQAQSDLSETHTQTGQTLHARVPTANGGLDIRI